MTNSTFPSHLAVGLGLAAALLFALPAAQPSAADSVDTNAPQATASPGATPTEADGGDCGMGADGSCCQACQQRARLVKEGKASGEGGCPCQKARALKEKQ